MQIIKTINKRQKVLIRQLTNKKQQLKIWNFRINNLIIKFNNLNYKINNNKNLQSLNLNKKIN